MKLCVADQIGLEAANSKWQPAERAIIASCPDGLLDRVLIVHTTEYLEDGSASSMDL